LSSFVNQVDISPEFGEQIAQRFGVSRAGIDNMVALFNGTLQPEIAKTYLSHLKAAIEDKINDRIKKDVIKRLAETESDKGQHEEFIKLIASKNIRPFSILFQAMPNLVPKATTRTKPSGALVFYLAGLEPKQVRILLAHELGHIALSNLGRVSNPVTELDANLFALIAIYDKSVFYAKHAGSFTYPENDLISQFELLCLGGVK
jgi:hypothetical protein